MFGTLAKMVSYAKAPGKTFIALHPVKALKFGAAYWAGRMLFGRKKREEARAQRA